MNLLKRIAPIIELIVAAVVISAWAIGKADYRFLITTALAILALMYFVLSMRKTPKNAESMRDVFIDKITYYSLSVISLGILFQLNAYPNAKLMTGIGGAGIVLASIGFILRTKDSRDLQRFKLPLIRNLILLAIGAALSVFV